MNSQMSIDLGQIKGSEKKAENNLVTQLPSPMLTARRRKSKIVARKNNQELIQEAYEQLLGYVDSVDSRVQDIIQTHQGQFLEAYKQHVKRLREQMEDIKRKSLNNSNSEKVYLEKIDILEKQLIIFRDESLKLFEKIIVKDKEIDNLQRKITILQKDNKEQEKSIYSLAKTKKQLQVQVQRLKNKIQEFGQKNQAQTLKQPREFSLDEKRNSQFFSPLLKNLCGEFNESRPYTTNIKSQRNKNLSLRLQSFSKAQAKELQELNWLKKRIEEKVGDQKVIEVQTVLNLLAENKASEVASKRGSSHDYRSVRNKFIVKVDAKRNKFVESASKVEKYSKQMRQDNQLKSIFKNCVDEVRKDIVKRNNIPSLNFFKENGPKNYIQFKKMDYYSLLQLLVRDQRVAKSLYEVIFSKKPTIQN